MLAIRCIAAEVELPSAADADADLLQRVCAGDAQARDAMADRYAGRMRAVAQRLLGCEDDSADAVQDSFCAALAAIDRFAGRAALSTWLHRIVVNACLMQLRSRRRRPVVSIDELWSAGGAMDHRKQPPAPRTPLAPLAPRSEQPGNQMESTETRQQIRACINRLPETHRRVLLLRDIEERDTAETAELLGLSISAVKTRLHRARQALRRLLEPLLTEQQCI